MSIHYNSSFIITMDIHGSIGPEKVKKISSSFHNPTFGKQDNFRRLLLTKDHMQLPHRTGSGVPMSKRPLSAYRACCKCPIETSRYSVEQIKSGKMFFFFLFLHLFNQVRVSTMTFLNDGFMYSDTNSFLRSWL